MAISHNSKPHHALTAARVRRKQEQEERELKQKLKDAGLKAKERRKRSRKMQQEAFDLKQHQEQQEREFIRQQEQELELFEQSRRMAAGAMDPPSQGQVPEAVLRPATLEAALAARNLGHLGPMLRGEI